MKTFLAVLMLVGVLGNMSFAQNEVPATTDKTEAAQAPAQEGNVVATVLDKKIYDTQLVPQSPEGQEIKPEEVEYYKKGMLTSLIFGSLIEGFIKENNVEPSADDIKGFVNKVKAEQEANKKEFTQKKAELEASMNAEGADEATKKGYADQIAQVDGILEDINTAVATPIDENVVKEFIKSWKINQALYAKYGGRVVFQQAGPEPIDAYKTFLQEQESKGSFTISDPKLKEMFWDYFVNESNHNYLSEEEAKRAMTTAWWLN